MQGLISSVGNLESGGGGGGSSLYIIYIRSIGSQGAFRVISFLSNVSIGGPSSLRSFIRSKGISVTTGGSTAICLPCMCGVVRSTSESFQNVDMLYCETTGNSLYYSYGENHGTLQTSDLIFDSVQLI